MAEPVNSFLQEKLLIATSVSVGLWAATKLIEFVQEQWSKRQARKNYIQALYAEIDFNTRDMEIFKDVSPDLSLIDAKLRQEPDFIPHITDARHTEIHRQNIDKIAHLNAELCGDIVRFYGLLEKMKVQIDGLQHKSFRTISPEGRSKTIAEIMQTGEQSAMLGKSILNDMEQKYSRYKLQRSRRRINNNATQSPVSLAMRYSQLCSDLDRVRSGH